MKRMTFTEYDNEMAKFEAIENPSHNYGITEKDMALIESDPDKFLGFSMYLLTRDWYKDSGDKTHQFDNLDAMRPVDVTFRLNEMLYDAIELYDEEDAAEA